MELWSAFLIGFTGSLHCVGMCGPIALSLPMSSKEKLGVVAELLIYNLGRIFTYSLIGVVVGFFGRFFFYSGWQQYMSIGIGILMMTSVVTFKSLESKLNRFLGIDKYYVFISSSIQPLFRKGGWFSLFLVGVINGWLPCGLVYMAVAGAFINYSISSAAGYMAVFGLGTLPLMLLVPVIGNQLRGKVNFNKFLPYFSFFVGILFVLRGLGLGIPYVSPSIPSDQTTEQVCD